MPVLLSPSGLTVVTGAYAFGHISGAHFNPAVTLGLFTAGRFPARDVIPYWIAQVAGSIAAAAVLYAIASGLAGFDVTAGFATNGYAEHSPQGYSLLACLICEVVMTAMFLLVILGVTSVRAPPVCASRHRIGAFHLDSPRIDRFP